MIKKATVRRAPRMKKRKLKGNIYMNQKWLGKSVVVLTHADYLALKKSERHNRLLIQRIQRISK